MQREDVRRLGGMGLVLYKRKVYCNRKIVILGDSVG